MEMQKYTDLLSELRERCDLHLHYDKEADVLYVAFEDVAADDAEMTDEDVIVRYGTDGRIVGYTILHASER